VLKSTRSYLNKTQEEVWREFNAHFRNPQRERGIQINHHDFLDAAFVHKAKDNSRRTFFSNVGGKSLDNPYGAYPIPE